MPCAIPPLDQSAVSVGRGFGLGYNRDRSRSDQLHAGMDLIAGAGTPVLSPVPGVVDFVTRNDGPRVTADAARGGSVGQVRQMSGYGNAVVLRHDYAVPGLPTPFFTSYNHLSEVADGIEPGAEVRTGTLLGLVGNTTNGQFRGMGAHLHMELRRSPFPGSYERTTMDPSLLFTGVGIDWVGYRREVERGVGGQLLIREDGPSGPAACGSRTGVRGLGRELGRSVELSELVHPCPHGWMGGQCPWCIQTAKAYQALGIAIPTARRSIARHRVPFPYIPGVGIPGVPLVGLGTVQAGYVDPVRLSTTYATYGTTQVPRLGSPAADVMPPDYAAVVDGSGGSSASGGAGALLVVGALAVGVGYTMVRKGVR